MDFFSVSTLMSSILVWWCIIIVQILQLEISCCMLMFYFISGFLSELQQQLEPHVPTEYLPLPDMRWHPHNETRALLEWNQLMKEWI
jgi:hypothetical protein